MTGPDLLALPWPDRLRWAAAHHVNASDLSRRLGVARTTVNRRAARHGIRLIRYSVLALLTEQERQDFYFLIRSRRYSRAAALRAVGRADILSLTDRRQPESQGLGADASSTAVYMTGRTDALKTSLSVGGAA